MIAYTGIETISNMAEEARDAVRTIPRSVGLTVMAVLGLYLLIPIVALSAMPVVQVDNAWSAPGVSGCGGFLVELLPSPIVNASSGLPAAAGKNTAILGNTIFSGAAAAVRKNNKENP